MVSPKIIMTTATNQRNHALLPLTENAEDTNINILKFKTTTIENGKAVTIIHEWDCSKQLYLPDYLKQTKLPFKKAGWIKQKDNACGFEIFVIDEFKKLNNIVYLLVYNNRILKAGKSKNKLADRSYGAGTQTNWDKSGKRCSATNYIFSQIFRQCLADGEIIEFYIYEVPIKEVEYPTSEGTTQKIKISPYEAVEKNINAHLKKTLGRNPIGEGDLFNPKKK